MRAVIADDEALSRRLVHQLLERHADVAIVAECADGAATREAIADLAPDVVFMDIRMPLGSGLDVARGRSASDGPLIVFVTAYDRFALPAFETDAVDYLTKPLVEPRFDAALERVRDRLRLRALAKRGESATRSAERTPHLLARVGSREVVVPTASIDYIEADDVYAAVVAGDRRFLVRTSLELLERRLDASAFARVHRKYIVRLDRIREIRWMRNGGGTLTLSNGFTLRVSRRRRRALHGLTGQAAR